MRDVCELIVLHDALGDVLDWYSHVLVPFHGVVQVEIFDVHRHEAGVQGGNDTVEEALDGGGEVRSWCADVAIVFDAVATAVKWMRIFSALLGLRVATMRR